MKPTTLTDEQLPTNAGANGPQTDDPNSQPDQLPMPLVVTEGGELLTTERADNNG